jgi:hypothetical protein
MAAKSYGERVLVNQLTFFAFLGVDYALFRWVLHAGHLAIAFAYVVASVGMAVVRLEKK